MSNPTNDLVSRLNGFNCVRLESTQELCWEAADEIERLMWRLNYIRDNRNDQTAISCALDCSDAQADEMRKAR